MKISFDISRFELATHVRMETWPPASPVLPPRFPPPWLPLRVFDVSFFSKICMRMSSVMCVL